MSGSQQNVLRSQVVCTLKIDGCKKDNSGFLDSPQLRQVVKAITANVETFKSSLDKLKVLPDPSGHSIIKLVQPDPNSPSLDQLNMTLSNLKNLQK